MTKKEGQMASKLLMNVSRFYCDIDLFIRNIILELENDLEFC